MTTIKNRDVYEKDPGKNKLLNNGVATVTDARSEEELRTLRYELETFVCDGEYERGLRRILEAFLNNEAQPELPGVWVSGFFGSGKSHLVKMLRALWVDFEFPEDHATARGLAKLPSSVKDCFVELARRGKRDGGLRAASGTLGAGVGDNVRMALLAIVFRSVGLPEEYPLARFVMWLKREGYLDAVRDAVLVAKKDWATELRSLYVSPIISKALLDVYPDFASSTTEARKLLKEQYPNVQEVTNQQLIDGIRDALSTNGKLPLTLIALDEIQQYIGENQQRSMAVQELTETCCKAFGSRLLFVGSGQTALSGTPMLTRLMGRFPVSIELSDADVDAVIRKVILAKKPGHIKAIEENLTLCLGEVSRHLAGSRIEHRNDDLKNLAADYPILPVRRRFWERVLRSVDQAGTAGQLRNQLKVVHEATRLTADGPLGTVVPGDFLFDQVAPNLLQTGMLSREIYEQIQGLRAGGPDSVLKARLCGLIFLIGKLPRETGTDLGVRATPDTLADLIVEDLPAGSTELRKRIPKLLTELEGTDLVMRVGDEYHLQTREGSSWNDEYRNQLAKIGGDPQRIAQERSDLFREEATKRFKSVKVLQGLCKEPRTVSLHFGLESPKDADESIYAWIRDGWEEDDKPVLAEVQAAGNKSPLIYVYVPKRSTDDLRNTLVSLRAATATLEVRGVPSTPEGEEARRAMETREGDAQRHLEGLLDDVFEGVRVYQAGGQEVEAASHAEALKKAVENSLVRIYKDFDLADHPRWAKVLERAQGGSEAALEAVDHKGDADKHPVTAAVLKYVAVGKKGAEVRTHFQGKDFGWPLDAIDGALYVLLVTGHLRASDANHKPVDAKSLERKKLAQTNFRIESTTVTALQRIEVRKLLQEVAGVSCKPNEEGPAIPGMLHELKKRAEGAGGAEPRPVQPDDSHITALLGLSGNELIVAVHAQRDTLAAQAKSWAETECQIQERLPRWLVLESLLQHASALPEAAEVQVQTDAVLSQRLLLANPDPVPPLCDTVTQALRTALQAAHSAYKQAHDEGMAMLKVDANWQQLTPDQRNELRRGQGLTAVPQSSNHSPD